MEPKGSLPCSQQPTTGPYPEPKCIQSTPHRPVSLRSIRISSYPPQFFKRPVAVNTFYPNNILCVCFPACVTTVLTSYILLKQATGHPHRRLLAGEVAFTGQKRINPWCYWVVVRLRYHCAVWQVYSFVTGRRNSDYQENRMD